MKRIAIFLLLVLLTPVLLIAGCASADRSSVAYQNESRMNDDQESYLAPSDRVISSADEPPSPTSHTDDRGR